jgi:hypothetical protein
MADQSATVTFTGSETHQDISWPVTYSSFRLLASAPVTTDGSAPTIRLCNPSNPAIAPTGAAVRVEPSALFHGTVSVMILEIP